jgi:hydrogenase maturation protein HypF
VGFRPYVYRLAVSLGLRGFVQNTAEGVLIEVEGEGLQEFLHRLTRESPPLCHITEVDTEALSARGYEDFRILQSQDEGLFTLVSPDVATCQDCLRELLDPKDRRYLYPFINCTNCGPRYSIIRALPYDRANTTMKVFPMCPRCLKEYQEPSDRRFHAEPNACPACGPELSYQGPQSPGREPLLQALGQLKAGRIVAIKGLGGFHLAVDATNAQAVELLRRRKRRSNKPFALMAASLEVIRRFCHVSPEEEAVLVSERRPIVLLRKREDCSLPEAIAPRSRRLGFMLPYTPLHRLLFEHPGGPGFQVLVMTSGNLSEEPIVVDNQEALEALKPLADAFLLHNRDIHTRVDDSVLARTGSQEVFIRRARGYAPEPIALEGTGPQVLAAGADLKNTFTLTKDNVAIVSQHIGDMESPKTLDFFQETLEKLKALYRVSPEALAYDPHPGYFSTAWALSQEGLLKVPIQHHYAHVASVMAEQALRGKCIGVAFDGLGYGPDGTLWGGEFLIADIYGFQRAGHIKPFPLPGGQQAIRQPWRVAVSLVGQMAGPECLELLERVGFLKRHEPSQVEAVLKVSEKREFSPLSSGAGRLFDAVSALLGLVSENTFEAEAAMALEACALEGIEEDYPVDISFSSPMVVDFSMTFYAILRDMEQGVAPGHISAKFHNTVATAIGRVVLKLAVLQRLNDVVLSGGVFQNLYLLSRAVRLLREHGLRVHTNRRVPANDGGVSLGQAYILRERLRG